MKPFLRQIYIYIYYCKHGTYFLRKYLKFLTTNRHEVFILLSFFLIKYKFKHWKFTVRFAAKVFCLRIFFEVQIIICFVNTTRSFRFSLPWVSSWLSSFNPKKSCNPFAIVTSDLRALTKFSNIYFWFWNFWQILNYSRPH